MLNIWSENDSKTYLKNIRLSHNTQYDVRGCLTRDYDRGGGEFWDVQNQWYRTKDPVSNDGRQFLYI